MGSLALVATAMLVGGCLLGGGDGGLGSLFRGHNRDEVMERDLAPDLWQNSLGMVFRPVPGENILMSIWETRVMDYQAFTEATSHRSSLGAWMYIDDQWVQNVYSWSNTGYKISLQHPVCCISWRDASAFCEWLTVKERANGTIGTRQRYRLPTDEEWSSALGVSVRSSRGELDPEVKRSLYVGNFHWLLNIDPFEFTAPVGSFVPNPNGFHDLAGNVWEYCLDSGGEDTRVIRGGSWLNRSDFYSTATARGRSRDTIRSALYGFRVVLSMDGSDEG